MTDAALPAWADAFTDVPRSPTLDGIEITAEWAYGDRSGAGVRVAVIDSGVDASHPWVGGLAGGVIVEPDPDGEPPDVRYVEGPHDDLYGHGTACAAIIRKLAPDVELWSVRVLGERLTGKAWVFAAGIEWCLDHGIQVLSLSLSTSNDDYVEPFHRLVDQCAYQRVPIIAAMANEHQATYPSEFAGVLSVAATEGTDLEHILHNPKPPAEWGAPGIDVEVAWLDGAAMTVSGNSFAAPVVAGHVARILGAHPGLTVWQVRTVLAALAANAG